MISSALGLTWVQLLSSRPTGLMTWAQKGTERLPVATVPHFLPWLWLADGTGEAGSRPKPCFTQTEPLLLPGTPDPLLALIFQAAVRPLLIQKSSLVPRSATCTA